MAEGKEVDYIKNYTELIAALLEDETVAVPEKYRLAARIAESATCLKDDLDDIRFNIKESHWPRELRFLVGTFLKIKE